MTYASPTSAPALAFCPGRSTHGYSSTSSQQISGGQVAPLPLGSYDSLRYSDWIGARYLTPTGFGHAMVYRHIMKVFIGSCCSRSRINLQTHNQYRSLNSTFLTLAP